MAFPSNFQANLISAFEVERVLFDPECPGYEDKVMKLAAMKRIGKKLHISG